MSERGIEALQAEHEEVLVVARSLSEAEWAAPSDCDGWRVQDVIAHLANTFRMAVDPASMPAPVPGDIEATQAVHAEAHRDWSPAEVLADYEDMATKGVAMFAGFQGPEFAELTFPMDNAGEYLLHLLPDAFTFDHFCHLRNDILTPHGPVDRAAPPADDLRVGVTVGWLLGGVPQMSGPALTEATVGPLGLRLTGPGGGEWTIQPAEDEGLVSVVEGLSEDAKATATSSTLDFVLWSTHRRPWTDHVQVEGDTTLAAPVLNAIHVY
ncbi:MAG TPA: maleylpyruvate isomerase family mycothiol-dependent enzyme [Acidimicrobiales bacterium]|jgi:uncharacterized protein (TIGR03083 family)